MRIAFPFAALCLLAPFVRGAEDGPEGLLIYHEPLTSYVETMEYQAFRQDNALFCTAINLRNERKQLKSGSIIAVVPYPPAAFEPVFEETAATALQTIDSLSVAHPQARAQLAVAKEKWSRALAAFRATNKLTATVSRPPLGQGSASLPPGARLTSATMDAVTVTHASGVSTIPLRELSPAQVLSLNATSRTIQLPLGTEHASPPAAKLPETTGPTRRLELTGRSVVAFFARRLNTDDLTFSVWTFFVVLPGLALTLLILLILTARRPRRGIMPARRPLP